MNSTPYEILNSNEPKTFLAYCPGGAGGWVYSAVCQARARKLWAVYTGILPLLGRKYSYVLLHAKKGTVA